MKSQENCGVCGKPLTYSTEEVQRYCAFCGEQFGALIYCPEGHYVCDECHRREALDILREILSSTKSANPYEILEKVISHPSVPMHGPEHHAIVPAVIIAAVKNAAYPVPDDAIEKAIGRGGKIPGGWCGFYGSCGAGMGVGLAVSIMTNATPLTGKERALANEATAFALNYLVDGQPRCCKKASRKAIAAAVRFLREHLNINLPDEHNITCQYHDRNNECPLKVCPFYKEAD
jgi:hypothetical protein